MFSVPGTLSIESPSGGELDCDLSIGQCGASTHLLGAAPDCGQAWIGGGAFGDSSALAGTMRGVRRVIVSGLSRRRHWILFVRQRSRRLGRVVPKPETASSVTIVYQRFWRHSNLVLVSDQAIGWAERFLRFLTPGVQVNEGFVVAIVDSDRSVPLVLQRTLTQGLSAEGPLTIEVFQTIDQALLRLFSKSTPVDLWMVDGGWIGDCDVNDFCAVLKEQQRPYVRMTGNPGHVREGLEGTILRSETSAQILLKPFELSALYARVRAFKAEKFV